MKLEIKHIAPYLPYGLKCEIITVTDNILIEKLTGFENRISDYAIFGNVKNGTNGVGLFGHCKLLFSSVKPILRPISDLSLLVIEEFEKHHGKRNGKANEEIINLFCEENGVDEILENIELKSLPYECVEYMFRNHYDVFGLIEQGLAVSIHDVQLKEIKT